VDLAGRSVEVILAGQAPSGAYVASPSFPPYRYSWWRDGAFIADAMSRVGQIESAERFFDWCAAIVRAHPEGPWDARYALDGTPDRESDWPQRQPDGIGLWLWALNNHLARHAVESRWDDAAQDAERWLRGHWREPSVDWWEEREGVHAATLASIWAGLGDDEIREEIDAWRLDGSLAFLVVLGLADERLLDRVEGELGYHRHAGDEYYGGGEWIILAALTGWARAVVGRDPAPQLEWIEAHATAEGDLPEQVQDDLLRPERYEPWVEKWGPPASPLLWSHAMYLTLRSVVDA
jgi:GH15 family glucan-1,4-alpha-glucosidase